MVNFLQAAEQMTAYEGKHSPDYLLYVFIDFLIINWPQENLRSIKKSMKTQS